MVVCSDKPHSDGLAVEDKTTHKLTYRHNWEALEELQHECNQLTVQCYGIGFGSLTAGVFNSAIWATGIAALSLPLKKLQKLSQIYLVMGSLLEAFEDQGVIITPRLEVPENGSLDLFVRFPNTPKAVFTIGLRSIGESKVFFNEAKETFFFRRKHGRSKPWQVDLFRRFALQEYWLRKNQPELFGQSSRDKNRPAVKILAITGRSQLGQHAEHLYSMISDQRVLLVRNRISIYTLEVAQLIDFIKAWLAQHTKPQNN
jgi:hypothetical protein